MVSTPREPDPASPEEEEESGTYDLHLPDEDPAEEPALPLHLRPGMGDVDTSGSGPATEQLTGGGETDRGDAGTSGSVEAEVAKRPVTSTVYQPSGQEPAYVNPEEARMRREEQRRAAAEQQAIEDAARRRRNMQVFAVALVVLTVLFLVMKFAV